MGSSTPAVELLLLHIDLDGPNVAMERHRSLVRKLAKENNYLWRQVRAELIDSGVSHSRLSELIDVHPQGCACWKCIKTLRSKLLKHLNITPVIHNSKLRRQLPK